MGDQRIDHNIAADERRSFMKRLLTDVQALEEMLHRGMIESDRRRIGAEQEMVLVGKGCRPLPVNMQVLERLNDSAFTTELAQFNLEYNLPPLPLGGDCLRQMETLLTDGIERVRKAAQEFGADVLLTGILPTLEPLDLSLKQLTPMPRYFALNDTLMQLRGGPFQFMIKGTDELSVRQDSVMLEACNTSFQVHFQVRPSNFAHFYNVAQVVSAPVLATSANSPLLFGRRLWKETRIAVFQQSVDARDQTNSHRELSPRVSFGNRWVADSAIDIYREDISRFRVLFVSERDEDPFACIDRGEAPKLRALQTHNSTVYRWNRVCYGVTDGKPHLRIENRYLPSGPTAMDEVANAAFWFGLMSGIGEKYGDVTTLMDFDNAKSNFFSAAQYGMKAQFVWLDGKLTPVQGLILKELLPLAYQGLENLEIDKADAERYLGIIEQRVASQRTGSSWVLDSLTGMRSGNRGERMAAVTCEMAKLQQQGLPVHEWPLATMQRTQDWAANYHRLEQFMTTDIFTVNQDDVIDLVANLMDWERIRHVPVEDNHHKLVGLVSYRTLLRYMARNLPRGMSEPVAVSDIMNPSPVTATPETSTIEAIDLMRDHNIACLPVVNDGVLVGIVTEHDLLNIAGDLIKDNLRQARGS